MKSYDQVVGELTSQYDLGPDFELREVTMWRVHCKHCGCMRVGTTPQTDKAFAALKKILRLSKGTCRNPQCITNGGTEKRRTHGVS